MIGTAINNSITRNFLDSIECGTVFCWGSNNIHPGARCIICNGATISRTTYSELFSKIGTTFGAGDGSTTFQIPNLSNDRFIQCSSSAGASVNAGLPNITATADVAQGASYNYNATGAFTKTTNGNGGNWDTSANCKLNLDASRSSGVYGKSSTVQPPALKMKWYIKY